MSRGHIGAAIAAMGIALSGQPVLAENIGDLRSRVEELSRKLKSLEEAQAAGAAAAAKAVPVAAAPNTKFVEAGSFPGSFMVPGTNTSIRIGALAKLDVLYDVGAAGGDSATTTAVPVAGTVAANRKGQTRLHARQSQIRVEARTPTDVGGLRAYIETDFYGAGGDQLLTNSTGLRIRHAYLELGPVLAGQTWTNFFDLAAHPETIDFAGPTGTTPLRQGQLRYTYGSGPHSLAVALENPEGDFTARDGTSNVNALDSWPDATARWTYGGSWGHVALRGMARSIKVDAGRPGQQASDFGYGLGLSGSAATFGRDKLQYQVNGGRGIGRYIQDAVNLGAAYNGGTDIGAQSALGAVLAYQHWWTDTVRSTAVLGHIMIDNASSLPRTVTKRMTSAHTNLLWSPIPAATLGLEYIYERRELESGADGRLNRLQLGMAYAF